MTSTRILGCRVDDLTANEATSTLVSTVREFRQRPQDPTFVVTIGTEMIVRAQHDEKFRSIRTEFIDTWYRSIANTFEHIKTDLVRNRSQLPNPAVYAIEANISLPVEETLLPIAKRSLVRYISKPQP